MPQISIIIPVYNVEKYIRQCLDSVISQTFTDWECWLIDDGSTDSSKDICDEYAVEYKRFNVIHKKNEGSSIARKCGMEASEAPFVVAIDSDDWVEPDYLQSMYDCIIKNDADVVTCGYYMNFPDNQMYCPNEPTDMSPQTVIHETLRHKLHAGLWCKMFKRSLFTDYDVCWPQYGYYEDMYVFVSIMQYAKKITYLPKATYHYRFNTNSLSFNADIPKRIKMYTELFGNLTALNEKYHLDKDVETSRALDDCVNFEKRLIILNFYNKYDDFQHLFKHFPNSTKLKYCRNIGDICFYMASKFGFILPYKIFKK